MRHASSPTAGSVVAHHPQASASVPAALGELVHRRQCRRGGPGTAAAHVVRTSFTCPGLDDLLHERRRARHRAGPSGRVRRGPGRSHVRHPGPGARRRAAGRLRASCSPRDWRREDRATVEQVWRIISHDGARPLVVRPSPVARDRAAGRRRCSSRPTSPVRAAELVDGDRRHPPRRRPCAEPDVPVLVQPHLAGPWRGVLFDGDSRRGRWRRQAIVVARRRRRRGRLDRRARPRRPRP